MMPDASDSYGSHHGELPPGEEPAGVTADDSGPPPSASVDPVISEPDTQARLIPVIRPSAPPAESTGEDTGLVRTVTESLKASWQAAASEAATQEWSEFDSDSLADDAVTKPRRGVRGKKRLSSERKLFDPAGNVRHVFRRVVHQSAPPTGQMHILDWLAGSPYENPTQVAEPGEADELVTINFVLDLGEALFRYGAGALEVESSIIAVTAAFGMKNTDADITNQSIILNWAPDGKVPYSRVRVVRSWSANFRALSEVHQLVTDIISGRLTRAEAEQHLAGITSQPKPYPRWVAATAGALFASLFASYTGAPPLDAALGFIATLMVLGATRMLTTRRVPEIFALAAGGSLATLVALGSLMIGADITPSMVVAGGLMILLPSVRIVSAIQDAINAFPITAAGRLVSSLVAFAGMTSGIMVAVVVGDQVGAPQVDVAAEITRIYHPSVLAALVFMTAMTAAIVQQAPYRLLLPTGAVAALGFTGFYAAEVLGLGEWFTPLIGATLIGALARVVALRLGAPQMVVAVPAMMFMLPGLVMFRGMYEIAISDSAAYRTAGLYQLFDALIIIMAIAAGIVLGDVSMRPLTKRLQSNERTRARRR